MKCFPLIIVIIAIFTNTVSARTFSKKEFVCPINGRSFISEIERSGSVFGMQLDLKPVGTIGAPPLLAQCPDNKFVLYREASDFSKEDISSLKKFILSPNYQMMAANNTTYYLAAKTMQHMKEDTFFVGYTLLKATWQVDSDPKKYFQYAKEAIDVFKQYLKNNPEKNKEWLAANVILGELLRRTGEFDESSKLFLKLSSSDDFRKNPNYYKVINYELKLIDEEDSAPHEIPKN